jgi:hypothetical protein
MSTPSQTNVALLTQDPNANTDSAILNLAGGGPTSQRPGNPPLWFHYFDLDLGKDVVWNGTDWIVTTSGPQGIQGAQGSQGNQGFQGTQGVQGAQGLQGTAGTGGTAGAQGAQGAQGPAGVQGPPGVQGPQGPQGSALPMNSGPTANRPSSPANFDRYFDTDINCQIWWERGAWRTVAGTPGEIKYVSSATTGDALTRNPGWALLSSSYQSRAPVFAGSGPGLTTRTPLDQFGEEEVGLTVENIAPHKHFLTKLGSNPDGAIWGLVDRGNPTQDVLTWSGAHIDFKNQDVPIQYVGDAVGMDWGSPGAQSCVGIGHPNIQPSIALIGLVKQ